MKNLVLIAMFLFTSSLALAVDFTDAKGNPLELSDLCKEVKKQAKDVRYTLGEISENIIKNEMLSGQLDVLLSNIVESSKDCASLKTCLGTFRKMIIELDSSLWDYDEEVDTAEKKIEALEEKLKALKKKPATVKNLRIE